MHTPRRELSPTHCGPGVPVRLSASCTPEPGTLARGPPDGHLGNGYVGVGPVSAPGEPILTSENLRCLTNEAGCEALCRRLWGTAGGQGQSWQFPGTLWSRTVPGPRGVEFCSFCCDHVPVARGTPGPLARWLLLSSVTWWPAVCVAGSPPGSPLVLFLRNKYSGWEVRYKVLCIFSLNTYFRTASQKSRYDSHLPW